MTLLENVSLAPFTTLRIGGPARFFTNAHTEDEVLQSFVWAAEQGLPVEVLGGGSNLLVPDKGFEGLITRVAFTGIEQHADTFDVAAGENWDSFVDHAVRLDYAGVECLAGVPGSVGATPVQNVGAYGQEVAQTVVSVRVYDRQSRTFLDLPAVDCRFRYRKSIFNTEARGRYVITRVRFHLRQGGEPQLGYADLQHWFKHQSSKPTLADVAASVRLIRARKGMVLAETDPDTWSVGSYFKNPIVESRVVQDVAQRAEVDAASVPKWPAGDHMVKLSAAWLLERAGFPKGYTLGGVGLSTKHALALTNRGTGTFADLMKLEETIRAGVEQSLGVTLEREPVVLGQDHTLTS